VQQDAARATGSEIVPKVAKKSALLSNLICGFIAG
jgi:hypothetical protein